MSKFIKDYIGLNGTYQHTILMREIDDIYAPFKYELYLNNDTNIKSNCDFFINNYTKSNIIIDSRMIKTITYISNIIDDILIYNVNNNEIISLTQFVMDKTSSSKILNINDCVNILNLFVFINFFCNKLSNKPSWNCDIALNLLNQLKLTIPNSFSIIYIYNYIISNINQNIKDKKITKLKRINIQNYLKIQDEIHPFQGNIDDIIYSLNEMKNIGINYILL